MAPQAVLAEIRSHVTEGAAKAPLVGLNRDQMRSLLSLDGRPVHPHDIRRLVLTWRMLQEHRQPGSTGLNWLGRLAAEANWRGLSSLSSHAVAIDWMGNREIDEHFSASLSWECTAGDARQLSGLDAASARCAFPAGTTPSLGDILEAQREAIASDPARVARQAAVANFAGVDTVNEMISEMVEDGLSLVWEHDDVPVARGSLLIPGRRGRRARSVMADTWSHLRSGKQQEALWIMATVGPMSARLQRVAMTPPYRFVAVPTSSTLLARKAPQRGR